SPTAFHFPLHRRLDEGLPSTRDSPPPPGGFIRGSPPEYTGGFLPPASASDPDGGYPRSPSGPTAGTPRRKRDSPDPQCRVSGGGPFFAPPPSLSRFRYPYSDIPASNRRKQSRPETPGPGDRKSTRLN